jgi:hypothetical protein
MAPENVPFRATYVVEQTLKAGSDGSTELVRRIEADGSTSDGLYVRKTFVGNDGRGTAYHRLFAAQRAGVRLLHVPRVVEYEEGERGTTIVCDYVSGRSLLTLGEEAATSGSGLALLERVAVPLCEAVSELHTLFDPPLIHRDIKPSNVIVDGELVTLIDYGIARSYSAGARRDTVRYGTPGFAPPEQFGYGQTTVASDLYALGMTLAFCLVGDDATSGLLERHFDDPRVPEAMRPVLVRATSFDPAARYGSARELQDAVCAALWGVAAQHEAGWGSQAPARAIAPSEQPANGLTANAQPAPIELFQPGEIVPTKRRIRWAVLRDVVGTIWNVALVVLWALMIYASIVNIIHPIPNNAIRPTWFIALEFIVMVAIPATALLLLLYDKRRIRERVNIPSVRPWKAVIGTIAFILACWLFVFVAYAIAFGGSS